MNFKFTDHSGEVLAALAAAKARALEKIGLTAEGYAKRLCPVDTGNLRNSITHSVGDDIVCIGTNSEYAPYVELGTGRYYPGGRQTPWVFQDANGNWHRTEGRKAQPFLKPAATGHTQTYKNIALSELKGE